MVRLSGGGGGALHGRCPAYGDGLGSSTPSMPLLAALPAGRYVVRAEGSGGGAALVAECVEAGAACAAWSAAAPVLGCGGSAAGRFDGGAAGGARRAVDLALGGAAADGREEVLLLVRLPRAARVQLDSCGSFADTRLRLYDGCPLRPDAAPLGVDGDSGQPRACRGGGGDGAAAERAQYGYAAVVTAELAAGDYWVLVDSDRPPAQQAEPEWQVRVSCDGEAPPQSAELCAAWTDCAACTAQTHCGWCASRAACLTGTADAALMDVCDAWDPFGLECDATASALGDEGPAAQLKAALPLLATVLVFAAAAALAARAGKRAGTSLV